MTIHRIEGIEYPKPPLPKIDKSLRLPETQYVPEEVEKNGIVLHHTVGGPTAKSVYNWWLDKHLDKASRVGTAYVIDGGGKIFEFFPDNCWAWHLGKGVKTEDEKRTVGIELCSEGPLVPVEETMRAFYNVNTGGVVHKQNYVDLHREWRGFRYFDAYSEEQIRSTIKLVDYLLEKFSIPRRMKGNLWDYQPELKTFKGIITHAQIRPDKTDVHPFFPQKDISTWCNVDII